MLRTALLCLLVSFSAPALAVYKCRSGDTITYSETPCPGGVAINADSPSPAESERARQQAAQEQKHLRRLENERRKREAQEEKDRQRLDREYAVKQKRCTLLSQRKKWADEDASTAIGRSQEKAKVKARRVAEQLEMECGKLALMR
jgi:hypothetical protein